MAIFTGIAELGAAFAPKDFEGGGGLACRKGYRSISLFYGAWLIKSAYHLRSRIKRFSAEETMSAHPA